MLAGGELIAGVGELIGEGSQISVIVYTEGALILDEESGLR